MKIRTLPHFLSSNRNNRGFAIIATLILMMLLTIIAVGLMATASRQSRIATQTMLTASARQQAIIGLDAAIAELQLELGPDQRISANSGILNNDENGQASNILGVWNSWDGPIYGQSVSGKVSKIDETYDKGRSKMFRRWLISSTDRNAQTDINAYEDLASRRPGERICLLGEGTLGSMGSTTNYIFADLIKMTGNGKDTAYYAWWVSGENQKAKITVKDEEESDDPYEVLRRTWNTPAPLFRDNNDLSFIPDQIEDPIKILSMNSLPLLAAGSQQAGSPYYFDVTTSSYSLPTNVRMGGLKQDLNLLLNKETLKNTEFARRTNQDCPIVEQGGDLPTGSDSNMPIGSWQNMHAYFNTWPNGKASESKNFTARLIGSVDDAYTRMSGAQFDEKGSKYSALEPSGSNGSSSTFFDTMALLEEGSDASGYARSPVMLAFVQNFAQIIDVKEGEEIKYNEETGKLILDGTAWARMAYAPTVLWWNPYNVPMKIRGGQMWANSYPNTTGWVQSYVINYADTSSHQWSYYGVNIGVAMQDKGVYVSNKVELDTGESFILSENDKTGDIVFRPGEILYFSPTGGHGEDAQNPWVLGDNVNTLAKKRMHFYTLSEINVATKTPPFVGLRFGINDPKMNAQLTGVFDGTSSGGLVEQANFLQGQKNDAFNLSGSAERMSVMFGFGGKQEDSSGAGERLSGRQMHSPGRWTLGWYYPSNLLSDDAAFLGKTYWSSDTEGKTYEDVDIYTDEESPNWVAAMGVVVKSANNSLRTKFADNDYRTKIWQHSNPASYGTTTYRPDEQTRRYSPYQLVQLDTAMGAPMDSIGKNGIFGITSSGENVSFISSMELPVHPPYSIAGFAGMRLTPGWYSSGDSYKDRYTRHVYYSGVPSIGIGNSFADPCLPSDDVYVRHNVDYPSAEDAGSSAVLNDFYDHGLLINDGLWDRFFCSSISDRPEGSKGVKKAEEVLKDFLDGKSALPVARYKKSNSPLNNDALVERIMEDDGWEVIAQYLVIDGGFNINSTSIEAWAATLQGLANRKLASNKNENRLSLVEESKSDDEVLFSRFMVSTSDKSIDDLGGYSMMQGSSQLRSNSGEAAAWGEVRKLDLDGIRLLSEEMVKQVRKRGPFLNMSDFINRRLDSGDEELSLKGALQTAIDDSGVNEDFDEYEVGDAVDGSLYRFPRADEGSIHTAAPGYLIQSDVLMSLGNIMTLRDDTFIVRAYGCIKNVNDAVIAQAWCEATVQRTIDYVDPSNTADEAQYRPDGSRGETLSDVNRTLGRKMKVVNFRWLDHWDI